MLGPVAFRRVPAERGVEVTADDEALAEGQRLEVFEDEVEGVPGISRPGGDLRDVDVFQQFGSDGIGDRVDARDEEFGSVARHPRKGHLASDSIAEGTGGFDRTHWVLAVDEGADVVGVWI